MRSDQIGEYPVKGLTRRDYFAAAALPGVIRRNETFGNPESWAKAAVTVADAMIAVLDSKGPSVCSGRAEVLIDSIALHVKSGICVPTEWVSELDDLLKRQRAAARGAD